MKLYNTLIATLLLAGCSGCSPIDRLNCLVNESTCSILENGEAVQSSTETVRRNTELVRASSAAIRENHKLIEASK